MIRLARIAAVLVVLLAAPPALAGEAPAELGRRIVEQNCSGCHAVGPTGSSPLARAPRFRELNARAPVQRLEDAFMGGRLGGHDGMPEFRLRPRELASLIAYIRSIQAGPGPT